MNLVVLGTQTGTTTRADGTYRLRLAAGTYELQVSYIGYDRQREKITVTAGGEVKRDFALQVMPQLLVENVAQTSCPMSLTFQMAK